MHYTISIKVDELRSMIIYDELDSCSICPFHKLCQKNNWYECRLKDVIEEGDRISIILE